MPDSDKPRVSRRNVIKSVGASTVALSLAGCTSDGSGGSGENDNSGNSDESDGGSETSGSSQKESYTVPMGAGSSGGNTFQFCQAVSRALDEHSEKAGMSVQETEGWVSNTYLYDKGNIPAVSLDNNTADLAFRGEGKFSDQPVENLPYQGFGYTTIQIYWLAVEGSGIKSTADLAGKNVYPIQPGFGTRLLTETILKEAGMWEDIKAVNVDVGDVPGAIAEDRIDAFATYGVNGKSLVSWGQQIDVNADVYAIEMGSNFENAVDKVGGARKVSFEPYGWEQDVTRVTDEVTSWSLDGQLRFGSEVPKDVVHEILSVVHNNVDTVKEADSNALPYGEVETFSSSYLPDQPVHPGAASFLKENDAWNDDWKIGETK